MTRNYLVSFIFFILLSCQTGSDSKENINTSVEIPVEKPVETQMDKKEGYIAFMTRKLALTAEESQKFKSIHQEYSKAVKILRDDNKWAGKENTQFRTPIIAQRNKQLKELLGSAKFDIYQGAQKEWATQNNQ